ncbi:amidase [Phenylobacterium sp.]|uniref:amidase n=1 Tax=Phenylobacterium sp. TaxID=1871053 RepID=UPI0025FAAA6D|nr:amidase [Phenylobacterium sp.]
MTQPLTATEALARMGRGELTAEALNRACLERVRIRDGEVKAWAHLEPAVVLAQALACDLDGRVRPLGGIPVGIKDVILTHDMPTRHNSPLYRDSFPRLDAACVSVLRSAGAVVFGKTDTVEFAATGAKALTRNPHDLARTPGGSSSGSAAAVADGHVPLALGTQTGGSILRPAAYCGVYGFKPTWGLVSREGVRPFAPSLDTVGWFARSADDLALLFEVFDPHPAPTQPQPPLCLRGARIGLCRSPSWASAEPSVQALFARSGERLKAAGAHVEDLDLPPAFDDLPRAHQAIMRMEGRTAFLAEYRAHGQALHEDLRGYVEARDGLTVADLCAAYDAAAAARPVFDAIAAGFDAILTPSVVGEAPLGLHQTGSFVFNGLWTLLHTPAVNVPAGRGPAGLALGLTLTGPRFADRAVLAAAAAIGPLLAGASVR